MPRTECLNADELNAIHLGDLPETALQELAGHLEGCAACEAAARALDDLPDTVAAAYRQSALTSPPPAPALPLRVGEYEILGEVGRGGMGVVYKARHLRLQRVVALKMLLGGAFAHGEDRARFRAEAEAVARLQHPHIVQIYEVGEHAADAGLPRPYFTLEFADGGNLAGRLAGRPQAPRQAASWLEALARAVEHAHEHGIVHRDLKPSNVLLTAEGQPKVCDFGVAKFLGGAGVQTLSGIVLGTAEYMAPEQASGREEVGPAADVYALGAILYAALTGRPPFQGTSAWHTLEQVLRQEPVPPRRLQPGVPRDLDTVCLKCLEKNPARRYASAAALADDLRRFLADQPIQARRPSPWERCARWVRHHKAATAALAVVAVTLVAAAAVSTLEAVQKEAERLKARGAEAAAVAAQKRAETAQQLAESRRELAMSSLYVAKTNLTGLTLDAPGGLSQVADLLREWRGFRAKGDPRGWEWYYCHALANPAQLTLRGHTADASALAWSPDGTRLASGGFDKSIRIWDADTGRQLRAIAAPWGIMEVSWSHDGRRLASANWFDKTVGIWNPDTGKEVRARLPHPGEMHAVTFSPDGRRLASADYGGLTVVWDAAAGKPLFRLQDATQHGPNAAGASVCWSPDGRRLATTWSGNAVRVWDGDSGRELGRLAGHTARVTAVRWSPDGRKLASAGDDGTVRIWDAATYRGLKTVPARAVETIGDALSWSPDSRRVAGAGRDLAVRVWDAESGQEVLKFAGHTGSRVCAMCWSPDGTRLASAERGWNGAIMVWRVDATTGPRTLVVGGMDEPNLEVCWSRDGRKLATAHKNGTVKLWDASSGGLLATLRGHAGAVRKVAWNSDGRKLASAGSDRAVKLWDTDTGSLLAAFQHKDAAVAFLSWSPDGTRLACNLDGWTVLLWDARAGPPRVAACRGAGAAWSPTDSRLAMGQGYQLLLHDADTDKQIGVWSSLMGHHNYPHWSPDGKRIATIADYSVEVRDAGTGRAVFAPLGHTQRVRAVGWSPDSKQLAAATEDNRIHLWDAGTGNPILTLRLGGQTGPINSVAWSPDGMRLACASTDGKITLWDATRGYESERAPSLLKSLDARLAVRPEDREALRLRAGVHARLGAWGRAAADAERLEKRGAPGFFQAGWWVADAAESGLSETARDPFAAAPASAGPRWYVSADDPNGYVPLAKEQPAYLAQAHLPPEQQARQPDYLTRVYVTRQRQVEMRLEGGPKLAARLWVNGTPAPAHGAAITLAQGWNTLAVRPEATDASSSVLSQPRVGFYLRLDARAEDPSPSGP